VLARPTASDVLAAQAAARYCLQLASVRRLLPVVDQLVYAARRVAYCCAVFGRSLRMAVMHVCQVRTGNCGPAELLKYGTLHTWLSCGLRVLAR